MFFAVDIDNTITDVQFYDDDLQQTMKWYIDQGIVKGEEIGEICSHPHFYIFPQVSMTHRVKPDSVETLYTLSSTGHTVHYFTVRNHFDPEQCQAIHATTHLWLETQGFPCSMDVTFCWDASEKLLQALKMSEHPILIIDDRPQGLLDGYLQLVEEQPALAQAIRERITIVAFGYHDTSQLSHPEGLAVMPLAYWSHCHELLSHFGKHS